MHSDIHVGSRLRLWAELNSSLENGRVEGPRPVIDEDKLALHQGFVEFEITQRSAITVRIRSGRQEIAVGSGRMYSLREGPKRSLKLRRPARIRQNRIVEVRRMGSVPGDDGEGSRPIAEVGWILNARMAETRSS